MVSKENPQPLIQVELITFIKIYIKVQIFAFTMEI